MPPGRRVEAGKSGPPAPVDGPSQFLDLHTIKLLKDKFKGFRWYSGPRISQR